MKRILDLLITKDKLVFHLTVICFIVILFSLFNFFIISNNVKEGKLRYKDEEQNINAYYACYDTGINSTEPVDEKNIPYDEIMDILFDFCKDNNCEQVILRYYDKLGNSSSEVQVDIVFGNGYQKEIESKYEPEKKNCVYAGKGLLRYIIKYRGKEYLDYGGEYIRVNGILRSGEYLSSEKKILIPYDKMSELSQQNKENRLSEIFRNYGLYIIIKTNDYENTDMDNLMSGLRKNNVALTSIDESNEEAIQLLALIKIIMYVLMAVSALNLIALIILSARRERKELAIRLMIGESRGSILILEMVRLAGYLLIAVPLFLLIEAIFIYVFNFETGDYAGISSLIIYLFKWMTVYVLVALAIYYVSINRIDILSEIREN